MKDTSTDQEGSGIALSDPKATWHFTEDQGTTFGDHTLVITTEGAVGGPTGEEPPVNGDTISDAVSWQNLSDGCVPSGQTQTQQGGN